ncbi:MAG: hypothetical protein SFY81_09045 [Verrucomicrobiota bacterium]|nr:hypothetical protein [Verrucomicrobiota bacterium]
MAEKAGACKECLEGAFLRMIWDCAEKRHWRESLTGPPAKISWGKSTLSSVRADATLLGFLKCSIEKKGPRMYATQQYLRKLQLLILALICTSSFAAGWDTTFPSPPLNSAGYEVISDVNCLGSDIYVAINGIDSGSNHYGYIARYSGGSWSGLPNSHVSGTISVLASTTVYNQSAKLFVGGSFNSVGNTNLPATNVAVLSLTSSPVWSAMVSGGVNGTDEAVHSLYAFEYWDNYFGTLYSRAMVYVGGSFTTAGNKTTPCIARWSGFGYLAAGWEIVGGGVEEIDGSRWVEDISVDHTSGAYPTSINAIYLSGWFKKTLASGTVFNSAKYSSSWNWTGSGLGGIGLPETGCTPFWYSYYNFRGHSVAHIGNVAYYGGYFTCAADKNGQLKYYAPGSGCSCSLCSAYGVAVAQLSSSDILTLPNPNNLIGSASSLTAKGSDLYAGGNFENISGTQFYAAKLSYGSWINLGGPTAPVLDTAANSTSVYFATHSEIFRYIP